MNPATPQVRHILTPRTARYYVAGMVGPAVREIVYALHGYGQLASRFLDKLRPLANERRLVIAPEALSRFYVRDNGGGRGDPHAGASWMTREDREHEIEDQVRYLDAVHAQMLDELAGHDPVVSLLGFSQGTATAGRWLARGKVRASTIVVWAGKLPHELDAHQLRRALDGVRLVLAVGDADQLAPAPEVALETQRYRDAGIAFEQASFAGGHELHEATLAKIFTAAPGPTSSGR